MPRQGGEGARPPVTEGQLLATVGWIASARPPLHADCLIGLVRATSEMAEWRQWLGRAEIGHVAVRIEYVGAQDGMTFRRRADQVSVRIRRTAALPTDPDAEVALAVEDLRLILSGLQDRYLPGSELPPLPDWGGAAREALRTSAVFAGATPAGRDVLARLADRLSPEMQHMVERAVEEDHDIAATIYAAILHDEISLTREEQRILDRMP